MGRNGPCKSCSLSYKFEPCFRIYWCRDSVLVCPYYHCLVCENTGYYGDNGSGIEGNNEYIECDVCEEVKSTCQNFENSVG